MIKIVNPLQVKLYIKNEVKPIDLYYNPNTDKIVYIFKKEDTVELYKKWCKRELK